MSDYPAARKMPRTDAERFFSRVDQGDCWNWTGLIDPDGYGCFSVGGRNVRAHRWSYEHHVGPIPKGLVLDHLCRNQACVRPGHLEPVTNRENLMRGETIVARAASATHCPAGHEYDELNTRISREGFRICRSCHRERNRKLDTPSPCPVCGLVIKKTARPRHLRRKHPEVCDAYIH